MTKIVSITLMLLAVPVMAQVDISTRMDRDRYISFEPINLQCTLRNKAGRQLDFHFGGYIQIKITDIKGNVIPETNTKLDVASTLILPSGSTKNLVIQLNNHFQLQRQGDFELTVRVGHRLLRNDFVSQPVKFEVRNGFPEWSETVGVPGSSEDTPIATRKFTLEMFHQEGGDAYVLKIEDDDYVYAVTRLGPRVQNVRPQCVVDAMSRLHTLVQIAPRQCAYRVFDVNGQIKQQQSYVVTRSIPRLIRDPNLGQVIVAGGRKAIDGVDYNIPQGPEARASSDSDGTVLR